MREALIVWGGWSGHESEQCAKIVSDMLEGDGFKVYVETTTEAFADPSIRDLSRIVPIITMSKIEKEEVQNLTKAVVGWAWPDITAACAMRSVNSSNTNSCAGANGSHIRAT